MQDLYERYHDKGFEILDFPCNQFGEQAPGSAEEISDFCSLNYHVTFRQFAKIEVNGDNAEPLFKFLKEQKGGVFGSRIKWNFTKFLVNKDGEIIDRFAPTTKPEKIEKTLQEVL